MTDDLKREVEALVAAEVNRTASEDDKAILAALRSREQDIEQAVERAVGERLAQAIAAEREACASICDAASADTLGQVVLRDDIAAAIRARGEQKA